jgi:hypothetical protein
MRPLALSALLLSAFTAFAQNSDLFDKAPPAIDDALRARVTKFYDAFIAGKFKEAYLLVADDSQDKFFELSKDQYKGCEIIKINYAENFTKASVVTSCKADWRFHGTTVLTTFPLTSTWKVIDQQWYWHWEKPTMVPSPFSPTGFVTVPADSPANIQGLVPKDIDGVAKGILTKVAVDKPGVHLYSLENSQDVVHVRNDMPGDVSLTLDKLNIAGLKITLGKADLKAHEETTIVFDWRLDDPAIQCLECAKKTNMRPTVALHVQPTGQVFPINVFLDGSTPQGSAPTQTSTPQK